MPSRSPTYSILLGLTLLLLAGGSTAGATLPADSGAGQSRAGLVVQFPDGSVQTFCISFDGDSITGMDLLLKSGLDVKVQEYGGMGAEVCKIGQVGCDYPAQPCACQSYGPGGKYWSYHHLRDGVWKSSAVGAGSYTVHNSDVDGWVWSDGSPPKPITAGEVCRTGNLAPTAAPPQATGTAVAAMPSAIPEWTPTLSSRPAPSATAIAQNLPAAASNGLRSLGVLVGGALLVGLALWGSFLALRRSGGARRG